MLRSNPIILVLLLACTAGCAKDSKEFQKATTHSWATESKQQTLPASIGLLTDSNRDGSITPADVFLGSWSWQGPGALVAVNIDDDDQDGIKDCDDDIVNGHSDESDLTEFLINTKGIPAAKAESVSLITSSPTARARLFVYSNQQWQSVEQQKKLSEISSDENGDARLAIEACEFASNHWDGFLKLALNSADGAIVQDVVLRVAPFLMLPNTAHMESFYISADTTGRYDNKKMVSELKLPLLLNRVSLTVHETDAWQEMWMQDTMELGYTETPTSRMHVVLNAPRGNDRFGPTLLGPNVGFLNLTQPRAELDPGDRWIDWFGNLEVSPPSAQYPHGRIYYGQNPKTGTALHPDVVDFLEAQQLQFPVALDTGWLFIKHVDEMLTFWPNKKAERYVAVLPSPRLAAEILGQNLDETNTQIQQHIDAITDGAAGQPPLHELFGINKEQFVLQPLLYESGTFGATGRWSNPVNSVALSSVVLYGRTGLPERIQTHIRSAIENLGLFAFSVDDAAYQPRLGNVHCGTNSKRSIPRVPFWQSLQPSVRVSESQKN